MGFVYSQEIGGAPCPSSQLSEEHQQPRQAREDPVLGSHHISSALEPLIHTEAFVRLQKLQQLGVSNRVFPGAKHDRYAHSISVGVLARQLAKRASERAMIEESDADGQDIISVRTAASLNGHGFTSEQCRATKTELLQLELAGFAHDLGHGPFSHLWERFLHSQGGIAESWSHEEMSEKLLDLAVKEARETHNLDASHFLCCNSNIVAAKCMIRGDSSGIPPAKTWLYTIVCNEQSGLDVDKLDYLLRDQLHVYGFHTPGPFSHKSQLDTLFHSARIVAVQAPDDQGQARVRTEIAFNGSEAVIHLVDDIFATRSIMHERVYQCREVNALEASVLHLLHSCPEGQFPWAAMSLHPERFVSLHDAAIEQAWLQLQKADPKFAAELDVVQKGGGWRSAGAWTIPEALLATCKDSILRKQVELNVLPQVAEDVKAVVGWGEGAGAVVQIRIAKIGDGAKPGACRAVQKVPFCCGEGTNLRVQWHEGSKLGRVYGIRTDGTTSCCLHYLHLHCWLGPHACLPHRRQAILQRAHDSFQRHWHAWVAEQQSPASRSIDSGGPSAPPKRAREPEQPAGDAKQCGTVLCAMAVVQTPPRKQQRVSTRGSSARKVIPMRDPGVVPDTDDEDDDEDGDGEVLTQQGSGPWAGAVVL